MSLAQCPFCEHRNPADSKFCSECGGALHLVPCPRCGAVCQITASACYQCGGQLPGRSTDALSPSSPVAKVSTSLPRRPSRVMVGTAVLAAIAVLGYYGYRQRSPVGAPQPRVAGSEASDRVAPAGAGVIDQDATPGDTESAKADDGAGLTSPASPPSGGPPATPMRAAASEPRAGRQPVKSQEAKASEPRPPGSEACTEAAVALGLCMTKPVQKKEPETAAAVEAAVKRPPTTGAGNAGGQEPPRPQPCTEALAALGLCTPKPAQRRE